MFLNSVRHQSRGTSNRGLSRPIPSFSRTAIHRPFAFLRNSNSCDLELVIEREGDELRIRQAQRRMGDALDKLIASHAVALDVALVTNNEADFVNYPGLAFENWVKNH